MLELHMYYEGDGNPCFSEIGSPEELLKKLPELKAWLLLAIQDAKDIKEEGE